MYIHKGSLGQINRRYRWPNVIAKEKDAYRALQYLAELKTLRILLMSKLSMPLRLRFYLQILKSFVGQFPRLRQKKTRKTFEAVSKFEEIFGSKNYPLKVWQVLKISEEHYQDYRDSLSIVLEGTHSLKSYSDLRRLIPYVFEFKFSKVEIWLAIEHLINFNQPITEACFRDYYISFHPKVKYEDWIVRRLIFKKDFNGIFTYIHQQIKAASEETIKEPLSEIEMAFQAHYYFQPSADPVKHFQQFVFKSIMEYNKNIRDYHSLDLPIVQSSCFGKTRLVLEASKGYLNLVYTCHRPDLSTGYPPQNREVDGFLHSHSKVEELEIFITCTFKIVCDILTESDSEDALSRQQGDSSVKFLTFWGRVCDFCRRCLDDRRQSSHVLDFFRHFQGPGWLNRFGKGLFYREEFQGKTYRVPTHLVIVFDESGELHRPLPNNKSRTLYQNLRKAHQSIESKTCVLVFIDTIYPSIPDYQPPITVSSSYRPPELKNKLLSPYYEVLTNDPDPTPVDYGLSELEVLAKIYSYGRPAWKFMFFRNDVNVCEPSIEDACKFAKEKLIYSTQEGPLSKMAIIAIQSIRYGIYGIKDHTLASQLVSSHMATCLYLGEDRLRTMVNYIPEPLIAEAACQSLHCNPLGTGHYQEWSFSLNPDALCKYLTIFIEEYISGRVDVGDLEKFMARIILSLSYDTVVLTRKDICFAKSISLREFFDQLLPNAYQKEWLQLLDESVCKNYIALYMEVDFNQDQFTDFSTAKVLDLQKTCPRHIMLLGTPQNFMHSTSLGEMFKRIQETWVDKTNSGYRFEHLPHMCSLMFDWVQRRPCNCKTEECWTGRCPCLMNKVNCIETCHCDPTSLCQNCDELKL